MPGGTLKRRSTGGRYCARSARRRPSRVAVGFFVPIPAGACAVDASTHHDAATPAAPDLGGAAAPAPAGQIIAQRSKADPPFAAFTYSTRHRPPTRPVTTCLVRRGAGHPLRHSPATPGKLPSHPNSLALEFAWLSPRVVPLQRPSSSGPHPHRLRAESARDAWHSAPRSPRPSSIVTGDRVGPGDVSLCCGQCARSRSTRWIMSAAGNWFV